MAPDTFVIVTARNEADRLGATLAALARALPGAPLWVADDGSNDGTAAVGEAAGALVVRCGPPLGKGGAATRGVEAVRASLARDRARASEGGAVVPGGEAVAFDSDVVALLCDADLGSSAEHLKALVEVVRRGEADIAVAAFARRVGGGLGLAVGFARWAIRHLCGLELRAPISGQRALRGPVLDAVVPFAEGFGMEVGMTIDAARAGYRLVELELDLDHRASARTLAGFLHRGRQLRAFVRVYRQRA